MSLLALGVVGLLVCCFGVSFWPPCMQLVIFLSRNRVTAHRGAPLWNAESQGRLGWGGVLGGVLWVWWLVVWFGCFWSVCCSLVWPPSFLLSLLSRWHSGCTRCSRYVCPLWTNFALRPPPREEEGGGRVAGCCGVVGFVLLVLVCLGCLWFLWLFPAPC